MTDLVTWVCSECGDPNIYSDWECQWDNELQVWVGRIEYSTQEYYCDECNFTGTVADKTERPLNLKELAQLAINKQEELQ